MTSAPARAQSATVPGGGADTAPLDARVVRQWAAANGITVPPRGPLSTRVREQYLAAH
ncbi:Lsr2 family DNA-binding protein [Kineococcus vitellinus]|uniref:Lsr2 family DNA-binding protein n=1 Tax=Kineococcus vitellinus TaxID=2696565 RepID=UPI003B833D42